MLTIRGYARHRKEKGLTGQTHGAVAKALDAGRIAMGPDGLIDPEAADAAWDQNTDQAQQRPPKRRGRPPKIRPTADVAGFLEAIESGKIPPFRVSQAAHEYYKAHKAKSECEAFQRSLLDAREVTEKVGGIISAARNKLLNMGDELADKLAFESDRVRCKELIDEKVRQALEELAKYP